MTQITPLENSPQEPALLRQDYHHLATYSVQVSDDPVCQEIKKLGEEIQKLEKQRNELADTLVRKVKAPARWKTTLKSINQWSGAVDVQVSNHLSIESPKPPTRERTMLEKILSTGIDLKTLFNSGILTKEEKREFLGLTESSKK